MQAAHRPLYQPPVVLETWLQTDYSPYMDQLPLYQPANSDVELAQESNHPHVAIAPGSRSEVHVVIRAEDDTDDDYEARRQLIAAALAFPGQN